jgi:hypothetical protein
MCNFPEAGILKEEMSSLLLRNLFPPTTEMEKWLNSRWLKDQNTNEPKFQYAYAALLTAFALPGRLRQSTGFSE